VSPPAAAVAAPHPAAVAAAEAAWQGGGNALDLALAAAAALVVVYPHQCALGGDLIALVRDPEGSVRAVVSAGAAPQAIDVDALRAAGERMPPAGPDTVTVPGVVAGWEALSGLGAARPLSSHLVRAGDLAAAGSPVAAGLARAIVARREAVAADEGLRELLMPGGEPLAEGAHLRQPRLAETLRAIAEGGFYDGPVGERLVAGLRRLGGRHDLDDLRAHRADLTEPLTATVDGTRWSVAPPPSQGATLLGLLRALADGGPPLHAVRSTAAARDALLGDPRHGPIDVDGLLAGAVPVAGPGPARPAGDTVAVAAVDAEGRAVTLIQSVYQTFGAGILEPETGIVLHNRGSAFSLVPGHPAELAGGARPPHTLCPAIVETADGAIVAAGCQGGRAQPQVLAQIAAAADGDSDLEAALARPRWVVGARDVGRDRETVLAEPGADAPDDEAAAAGIPVERLAGPADVAGHVQVARLVPGGESSRAAGDDPIVADDLAAAPSGATVARRLSAAADPRADGRAVVLLAGGRG
jgi:gamma-glutamyltranspeptidase